MRRFLWTLGAIFASIAWLGAFRALLERHGVRISEGTPVAVGMLLIHCGSVWLALRLRASLHATGSGSEIARFDRPGTSVAYRLTGALALALSLATVGLMIEWVRPLFA